MFQHDQSTIKNKVLTWNRDLTVSLPARKLRNAWKSRDHSFRDSVCAVVNAILADPTENRAKIRVFSRNVGNLPRWRAFLEDMLFAKLRFCCNEAVLDGQ